MNQVIGERYRRRRRPRLLRMAAVLAAILGLVWWWSTPSVPSWRERITLSDLGAATAYRVEDLDDYKEPLRFSPDGKILADVPRVAPSAVRLWDASTGTLRAVLRPELAEIPILEWLAFSPDGKILVAGGDRWPEPEKSTTPVVWASQGATAWDVASGRRLAPLRFNEMELGGTAEPPAAGPESSEILDPIPQGRFDVAFDRDGKFLWIAAFGSLTAWDTSAWSRRVILSAYAGEGLKQGRGLAPDAKSEFVRDVSAYAGLFATWTPDGASITLRAIDSGRVSGRLPVQDLNPLSSMFSPDGRYLAVSLLSGDEPRGFPQRPGAAADWGRPRPVRPRPRIVRLWSVATGAVRDLPADGVGNVRFTPDGKSLVLFATKGRQPGWRGRSGEEEFYEFDHLRLLDLASGGSEVISLPGSMGRGEFTLAGRSIAVAMTSTSNTWLRHLPARARSWMAGHFGLEEEPDVTSTVFYDLGTGRPRSICHGLAIGDEPVAIAPDGKVIAVSGSRGTVTLFDAPR